MSGGVEESLRFCPTCDYHGTDIICPICSEKMVSEDGEMDRIIEEHEKAEKQDLLGEDSSLEDLTVEEDLSENITEGA